MSDTEWLSGCDYVLKNNKLLCIVTVNYVHIFDTEIKLFVFYF